MNPVLGNMTLSPGAACSRQSFAQYALKTMLANGHVIGTDTFAVDPTNPFFLIYAGWASNGTIPASFFTTHTFTNGGSVVSSIITPWGEGTALDNSAIVGNGCSVNVVCNVNDGIMNIHDPLFGACAYINNGVSDVNGFVKRWSSLADKVVVSTSLVVDTAYDFDISPINIIHGILQQPWS